jgi:hypothetical protein
MGLFGWTAQSLVPPHSVSAFGTGGVGMQNVSQVGTPAAQTFTTPTTPQLNIQPQMQQILAKILGPNYQQGTNPSPIAGSQDLYSPNYLAQVNSGTAPQVSPNGFTRFGNSFWRMPAQQPAESQQLSGTPAPTFAPAATSYGAPSAWTPNQTNLFNI